MKRYSVSPGGDEPDRFETVQRALQAVRELPRPWTGDVVVDLEPAVYRLTEPIEIGPDDGGGTSGTGSGGGGSGSETVPIKDVRLVPVPGDESRYCISFVATLGGRVRLELSEAGDSSAIARGDVQAFGATGEQLELDGVELTEGERMVIEITGTDPIGDRAWRVRATREVR